MTGQDEPMSSGYRLGGAHRPRDVRDAVVVITGAARGLGAEMARRLAAEGARVALVGIEADLLRETAALCGPEASAWDADVTSWVQLQAAFDGIVARYGGVDHLIVNAGIAPPGFIRSIDPADFERTIEVNLLGVWRTVRTALPYLIDRQGYLLVVSSLASVVHGPAMAAYCASKAGCEAFAESLRIEVAHLGVDVGVAYFSWIATDMVGNADAHPVFGTIRSGLPGLAGRVYPVALVGDAVVDGVRRRARTVMVPGWIRQLRVIRGLLEPITRRGGAREVPTADRAVSGG